MTASLLAIDHVGRNMESTAPDYLAFTLAAPDQLKGHSVVNLDFKPIKHGTRMVFQQTGVAPEVVVPSWGMMFDSLEGVEGGGLFHSARYSLRGRPLAPQRQRIYIKLPLPARIVF